MKRLISSLLLLLAVACGLNAKTTYTRVDSLTVVRLLSEAPGADPLWLARQLKGLTWLIRSR